MVQTIHAAVGFALFSGLAPDQTAAALKAQERARSHTTHLDHTSLCVGIAQLDLWGHGDVRTSTAELPDGSVLAVIGSPHDGPDWKELQDVLLACNRDEEFILPWDGRVVLLRISRDGRRWTMWNDWIGSIPVYHAEIAGGRIASTLEPVVVEAGGFSYGDVFTPGLVSLLINGHFLADWTLFKGMHTVPPDSVTTWDDGGPTSTSLWTVKPTRDRWETGWDDLIDEMHALAFRAIEGVLRTDGSWILPLSSGLDSRLIAAVSAEVGACLHACTWGELDTTDVIYSRQVARTLGIPWTHIDLPKDFLATYTPVWADWFGSSMHFHGMYQMCFFDAVRNSSSQNRRIVSGFYGDVLAGIAIEGLLPIHTRARSYHLQDGPYVHWTETELRTLMRTDVAGALEANAEELASQFRSLPGAAFQRVQFMETWGRQRMFGSFQTSVSDCWNGVAVPFMNREYARFCMSLPLAALGHRRLLAEVFRRHYSRLSAIPGTYGSEPYRLTGRYLLRRRAAGLTPRWLRRRVFPGIDEVPLRLDVGSVRALGTKALWPIYQTLPQLANWLDVTQIERQVRRIMTEEEDLRPLRKLQSIQALAYRLSDWQCRRAGTGPA